MDDSFEFPEKLFFKIGEVSRIVDAEPHVLRYWEKEFAVVRPRKSRGGQRLYRRADVEALLRIKTLLRDEKFTVAGAKRKLAEERGRRKDDADGAVAPAKPKTVPSPAVDRTQSLFDEVELLKSECQDLRQARAHATRRLAAAEEALRQVRRELSALLDEVDKRERG